MMSIAIMTMTNIVCCCWHRFVHDSNIFNNFVLKTKLEDGGFRENNSIVRYSGYAVKDS